LQGTREVERFDWNHVRLRKKHPAQESNLVTTDS
jgi:hypothetical protein